jgi:hypothetical protein
VPQITAFLFSKGGHEDPEPLAANLGKSFLGSKTQGLGFIFDDSGLADESTPGTPMPTATMQRLIRETPKNSEVIFPYIGGEEINTHPAQAHYRYVIDFRDRSEEECRQQWPEIMDLLDSKVKPQRQERKANGEYRLRHPMPERWWIHGEKRPALYSEAAKHDRVLAISRVTEKVAFASLRTGMVYSERLAIFKQSSWGVFLCMQARPHELYSVFFGSTLEDRFMYAPSDCFETFPFPPALLDSTVTDNAHEAARRSLEAIGERYHQFRAELMVSNNEGLTSTYNRFHHPAESSSSGLLELRRLHGEMDQAVLAAYGWSDVPTACGFGLDYLDTEEDAQFPDELQERIDSGDLFFWDAGDALDFQGQLQAYGAITGRRKLPWRYRWPDSVRDDVLARLLALNAERYAEEVALGLHSKGAKLAAGARRGRKPKTAAAIATSAPAFQLEPEPLQIGLDFSGGR